MRVDQVVGVAECGEVDVAGVGLPIVLGLDVGQGTAASVIFVRSLHCRIVVVINWARLWFGRRQEKAEEQSKGREFAMWAGG